MLEIKVERQHEFNVRVSDFIDGEIYASEGEGHESKYFIANKYNSAGIANKYNSAGIAAFSVCGNLIVTFNDTTRFRKVNAVLTIKE